MKEKRKQRKIKRLNKKIDKKLKEREFYSKIIKDHNWAETYDLKKYYQFIESDTEGLLKRQLTDRIYLIADITEKEGRIEYYITTVSKEDILVLPVKISWFSVKQLIQQTEDGVNSYYIINPFVERKELLNDYAKHPRTEMEILSDIDKKIKKLKSKVEKLEV